LRLWLDKLKEALYAVLPIVAMVLITALFFVKLSWEQIASFLLSSVCIIAGLTVFLAGVDRSVTQLGQKMGENLVRYNRMWIIIVAGLLLGFIISVAEPDLHILASQVSLVTAGSIGKWSVVMVVSVGIAVLVSIGLVRILFNYPLYKLLIFLYIIILGLSFFTSSGYLAISFDSSGATTGAMTVPFILALALGVSKMKKDSKASEKDSFGLVAIASVGAIVGMLIMGLIMPQSVFTSSVEFSARKESILVFTWHILLHQAQESLLAIAPISLLFIISQPILLKLKRQSIVTMLRGLLSTYVGLVLIFTGANAGFMEIGREIGSQLSRMEPKAALLCVGFVLGLVTVLAEPAVHVLVNQIEEVTSGFIRRSVVMVALSLGVGLAVVLSVLRILIPGLQLWHILLPGYALALILAVIGPKLFVGIAFDSGGVASGPMTATFILAFAQGAANEIQSANVMVDGFGLIALVALTPIITLQLLGLIYHKKAQSKGGPNFV
jgi:hypothetical protein